MLNTLVHVMAVILLGWSPVAFAKAKFEYTILYPNKETRKFIPKQDDIENLQLKKSKWKCNIVISKFSKDEILGNLTCSIPNAAAIQQSIFCQNDTFNISDLKLLEVSNGKDNNHYIQLLCNK